MRTEIFNAFIVAANTVLTSEANVQAKRGQLSLARDAYITDGVTVLFSLVGDVWGIVIISLGFETAKNITARILGQEFDEFNELAQSGVGELGNVIVGQASTKLSEFGYRTQISVPTLIVGKGARISTLDIDRIVVPLQTEIGSLYLNLALRESSVNDPMKVKPIDPGHGVIPAVSI